MAAEMRHKKSSVCRHESVKRSVAEERTGQCHHLLEQQKRHLTQRNHSKSARKTRVIRTHRFVHDTAGPEDWK